jgi:cation:H+ antiporter
MFLAHLSTLWLIVVFIASGVCIWISGIKISTAIDYICKYFNLGEAIGGMIFLAIVTNLPEIAITSIAAYNNHIEIAISNILGGIAIQTVVLVLIDCFGVGRFAPLSFKASSVGLILEGIVLIFILTLVIVGKQVSTDFLIFHASMVEWIILFVWLSGLFLIYKNPTLKTARVKKLLPIYEKKDPIQVEGSPVKVEKKSAYRSIIIFIIFAILTLASGFLLEISSEELASRFNISGVIFGATILAAVTSLPEISTGIASAKLKDYQMAVSDILGGNAFLPVLLLLGSIISGKSIMTSIGPFDLYISCLGILLTGVYMIGLIIKSEKQIFRMGYDSIAILIIYIIGVAGLLFVK